MLHRQEMRRLFTLLELFRDIEVLINDGDKELQ